MGSVGAVVDMRGVLTGAATQQEDPATPEDTHRGPHPQGSPPLTHPGCSGLEKLKPDVLSLSIIN